MAWKLPVPMSCTIACGDWEAWVRSSTIATQTTNSVSSRRCGATTIKFPTTRTLKSAGIRDIERERDALGSFSWAHTFRPGMFLTVSPFYHYNRANYDGDPNDTPISTTQHRGSQYAGAQIVLNAVTKRHNASIGLYGFGQHDDESVNLIANDGTGLSLAQEKNTSGHLETAFLEDQYKAAVLAYAHRGSAAYALQRRDLRECSELRGWAESIRIPHLNWVLRGFWGEYYQAPPLSTVSGPLLDFAVSQGLGFIPLRGERDQEHQFGLTIPAARLVV